MKKESIKLETSGEKLQKQSDCLPVLATKSYRQTNSLKMNGSVAEKTIGLLYFFGIIVKYSKKNQAPKQHLRTFLFSNFVLG